MICDYDEKDADRGFARLFSKAHHCWEQLLITCLFKAIVPINSGSFKGAMRLGWHTYQMGAHVLEHSWNNRVKQNKCNTYKKFFEVRMENILL